MACQVEQRLSSLVFIADCGTLRVKSFLAGAVAKSLSVLRLPQHASRVANAPSPVTRAAGVWGWALVDKNAPRNMHTRVTIPVPF